MNWLTRDRLHLAVDLSLMLPGGASGGIRPAVLQFLQMLRRREGERLRVTFLTNTLTHRDIINIRRKGDRAVCILSIFNQPLDPAVLLAGDLVRMNPGAGLSEQLGASAHYCAIGEDLSLAGNVPSMILYPDLLHRDCPITLTDAQIARRELYHQKNLRRAAMLHTISEFSKERFAHAYGVRPDRVVVSYIPVPIQSAIGALADGHPLSVGNPYFFYPANFWAHKNHDFMLEAYSRYAKRCGSSAWRLVLTGHDDELARRVMKRANKLGLASAVLFLGHVDRGEYWKILKAASGLLFLSRYEGFGMPLVEAMGVAVPVLTTKCGSIPEICGDAAGYCDAADVGLASETLWRFTHDESMRKGLVARGRRRFHELSLRRDGLLLASAVRRLARFAPGSLIRDGGDS